MKRPWMVPPFGGPEAARLRANDGEAVRRHRSARSLRAWIPAFAGMTVVVCRRWSAHSLRAGVRLSRGRRGCGLPSMECPFATGWIPAFAGTTVVWFAVDGVPIRYGLGSGFRQEDGGVEVTRAKCPVRIGPGSRLSPG